MDMQPRDEAKKNSVKEISALLANMLPYHSKTQVKDKDGKWTVVDQKPKPAQSR